ncbi:hypothetical protein BK133_11740 [Paenibacillus sp. FSL H8-0548]|uniref:hypothetical protein n=1 Tax=Paenibacillus sp. FSL H8-0548 TaxID=1920422 RepID=UPI00096F6DD6|nr:hypothetical protein [Paenibacillus sp. FSL H8-0548]OMF34676.1 hypothetical protein BK133_11740 [Paenibacillus sp. FSL H8-0548]
MKKAMAFLIIMLLLAACGNNADITDATLPSPTIVSSTDKPSQPIVAATAQEAASAVILALKESDMTALGAYAHPVKGLLFSPYAHIDTATAKIFPAAGLPALTDTTVYNWGFYDGSGDPISLTFQQYYDKFVYDKNFLESEMVGADEIIGTGNTLVNIKDVFPSSYVMDYYFSGFDEQYEGMDWESLILVLEEMNGAWYVSAIVHSQWTI